MALNLARAVQLSVDIATHWIANFPDVAAPITMGGAFDALAQVGGIDVDLASRLKKAVGFHNLAVHNYEAVNWEIVHFICTARLTDFDDFAAAVMHAFHSI